MSAALCGVSAAEGGVSKPAQVGSYVGRVAAPECGSEVGLGFDTRLRRYSPRGRGVRAELRLGFDTRFALLTPRRVGGGCCACDGELTHRVRRSVQTQVGNHIRWLQVA